MSFRFACVHVFGLSWALPSCAPPCNCPSTVPRTAAQAPEPQTLRPTAVTATTPEAAPFTLKPLAVWDGEGSSQGSGWASCEPQRDPECKASLQPKAGVGRDGSTGLEFVAKGREWLGFGWNWFSWWPSSAGSDISEYKSLAFAIKVSGEPGKKPEPFTVQVWLSGSAKAGKDETEQLRIHDYVPAFADGEWHDVVLPLEPMLRGKGETFDTNKAWGISVGAWNQGEREYTIQLDDIKFL